MPVPLIPVAAGVGAFVATGGLAILVAKLTGVQPVAILGGSGAGKTTLLRALSGITDHESESGVAFELTIKNRKKKFRIARDLRGADALGHPEWRKAFESSTNVWYLFRADLIAADDKAEVSRVVEDLEMLRAWLPTKGVKKVLLIGTWADVAGSARSDMTKLAQDVRSSDALRLGALKLGNAPILVGSLRDQESTNRLTKRVAGALSQG